MKELIEDVQNISKEEFEEMLNGMVRFHQYSLFNQFILMIHGCSQVAGYRKWKELGRTVKKEEKAVWILAPYFKKEIRENEEEERVIRGFFSVSSCIGKSEQRKRRKKQKQKQFQQPLLLGLIPS